MSFVNQEECEAMTKAKYNRRAGVRFTFLLRQLEEEGWSQTAIADAIGCHQTLISKWWWRGAISYDLTQKGLRDDVIQGIYEGLHVRSDYLVMPTPKDYHKRIRLPSGETRPAEPDELDHREYKVVVTNEQFERARDRKEVAAVKSDVASVKTDMAELRDEVKANSAQLAQLLALLAKDAKSGR